MVVDVLIPVVGLWSDSVDVDILLTNSDVSVEKTRFKKTIRSSEN